MITWEAVGGVFKTHPYIVILIWLLPFFPSIILILREYFSSSPSQSSLPLIYYNSTSDDDDSGSVEEERRRGIFEDSFGFEEEVGTVTDHKSFVERLMISVIP